MTNLWHPLHIEYFENHLTDQPSYKARVRLRATLTNEDIARRIAERRIGSPYEVILQILRLGDSEKIEALANGYAVMDGAYHASPSITGRFDTPKHTFDASEHTAGAVVVPSPELRKTMKKCKVKVTGCAVTGPVILALMDVAAKVVRERLAPRQILWIHGLRLKITGDDPAVGVHFVPVDAPEERIGVDEGQVVVNTPKKLLLQVPDLPAGKYFVEVTTQYTNGGTPVKTPRTYRLPDQLSVDG